MTMTTPPTDEELTAWLDGELDIPRTEAVTRAVEADPATRARLDALTIDRAALAAGFGALAANAPPMPALPPARTDAPPRRRAWPSLIAAGLAGAILAGGALSMLSAPSEPGWKDYVAAYQALYVPPTLAHLDPDPADQARELARVSRAIGRDLPLDALREAPALDYRRGQILGFRDRPLVQLAFQSADGTPYALCLIRQDREEPLTTGEREGLRMASWAKDGYAWMLIGGTDAAVIDRAAKRFSASL